MFLLWNRLFFGIESQNRIGLPLELTGYRPTFIRYLYYNKDFFIKD